MRYHEIISETFEFTSHGDGKMFYHGTKTLDRAKSIWKNGILPQDPTTVGHSKRGMMTPVDGMVYLTPNLKYATIYALGGSYIGQSPMQHGIERDGQYGYVFGVPGESLSTLQPDEDEVGNVTRLGFRFLAAQSKDPAHKEVVSEYSDNRPFEQAVADDIELMRSLVSLARYNLTDGQQDKLFKGYDYNICAQAGKKLVKVMPQSIKLKLVQYGCHIAHQGSVKPTVCYRIDKMRSKALGKDNENFFKIARSMKRL